MNKNIFIYLFFNLGAIAQMVEHLHGMQGVSGSSPLGSILYKLIIPVSLNVIKDLLPN